MEKDVAAVLVEEAEPSLEDTFRHTKMAEETSQRQPRQLIETLFNIDGETPKGRASQQGFLDHALDHKRDLADPTAWHTAAHAVRKPGGPLTEDGLSHDTGPKTVNSGINRDGPTLTNGLG